MAKCLGSNRSLFPESLHQPSGLVADEKKLYALERLVARSRKKFLQFASADADQVAISTFLECNSRCVQTQITLSDLIVGEAREFITHALECFTRQFDSSSVQQSMSMALMYQLWRFGPGASNGIRGTHFAEKISQPMTCTKRAEPFCKTLRSLTPRLARYDYERKVASVSIVEGSRTQPVPKNETTSRLIAIEPSGNMALQLAAGTYIEGALRRYGVYISSASPLKSSNFSNDWFHSYFGRSGKLVQSERNKQMARQGSIDGSLCTIDLKSASDLITPNLIRVLWPCEWYHFFEMARSPVTEILGTTYELNMMSTMGNGFTFPMMTLTLAALCYAIERLHNKRSKRFHFDSARYGVFGDDIICPTETYEALVTCLEAAGLIVNNDKSYSTGFFRESCGGDYYKGYDVTPFYIKSLAKPHEVYVAINQVITWSIKHDLILWEALRDLRDRLPRNKKILYVPEWEDPSSGILCKDVPRHYTLLVPSRKYKVLRTTSPDVQLLCILGGYVEGKGQRSLYLPRCSEVTYIERRKRLPKGWRSGRFPTLLDDAQSDQRQMIVDAVFNCGDCLSEG